MPVDGVRGSDSGASSFVSEDQVAQLQEKQARQQADYDSAKDDQSEAKEKLTSDKKTQMNPVAMMMANKDYKEAKDDAHDAKKDVNRTDKEISEAQNQLAKNNSIEQNAARQLQAWDSGNFV